MGPTRLQTNDSPLHNHRPQFFNASFYFICEERRKLICSRMGRAGGDTSNIWDSFRENYSSHLYIKCYIMATRLNRYIFRTRLTLSTSYFHHFIPHHFSIVKYSLGFCTCSVLVLQRPIPHRVQTQHNFL